MRRGKGFLSALLVLALLVTSALAIPPVQAPRDKKTLNPKADSCARSDSPAWNTGREWYLWVEERFEEMLSFLMFDLSQIPSGATIERAKLRLHTTGDTSKKAPVSVYHCPSNDWTEEGITYNNKPAFSPEPVDTANVTTPMTWYEWNVTATVQSAFEADGKRLSLVLKADTYGLVQFQSKNDPLARPPPEDTRPQLVVLYEAPPPSGTDPILTATIIIAVIAAVAVGLGSSYILLKRRRPSSPKPSPSR